MNLTSVCSLSVFCVRAATQQVLPKVHVVGIRGSTSIMPTNIDAAGQAVLS